jgi:hypothetical protein
MASKHASKHLHTLPSGKRVLVTAEEVDEGSAEVVETSEGEQGTWPALRAACNMAARNGRHAFQRFVQELERDGWSTDDKLKKLLQKVERASRLGQMDEQVEILAALTTAQRDTHVLPAKSTAADRRAKRMSGQSHGTASEREPARAEEGTEGHWKRKFEALRAETTEKIANLKADLAAEVRMREAAEQRAEQLEYDVLDRMAKPATRASEPHRHGCDSSSSSSSEASMGSDSATCGA